MPHDGNLQFEDGLNQMAVIRTTFETLEFFPDDDEMRREFFEIIETTRYELAEWLYAFIWQIETHPEQFGADWDEFRDLARDLATRGFPGRNMDAMMRGSWFGDVRFFLELPEGLAPDEIRSMDGVAFLIRMLRHLHARITDRASFVDQTTFNRTIYQTYIALMFLMLATTDPLRHVRPPE